MPPTTELRCGMCLAEFPAGPDTTCPSCGSDETEPADLQDQQPLLETDPVTIHPCSWRHIGSDEFPDSRLLTTLRINGIPHHLEAIEIHEVDDVQEAIDPAFAGLLVDLDNVFAFSGAFYTTQSSGRTYALFLSPFCQ